MSERRFDAGPEEPGDPLDKQEEDTPERDPDQPTEGEPWAKTSSGDADEISS